MLIPLMLMVFLLACCAGWLLLFPSWRELALRSMANLGLRLNRRLQRLNHGGAERASSLNHAAHSGLARGWRCLTYHRWLSLFAVLLICLPPALAWLASGRSMLGAYDGDSRVANAQVSALLKGEQLVPPPAPPPLAFTTLEVLRVRPLLDGASRNWQLLDHDFAQRLLLVFKVMKEVHGIDMVLLEGYRSPDRQNLLAAAGPNVSNARAFQSYHQFGLAADCAFFRDGKLLISEKDPWAMQAYRLYGEAAEAAGLTWGGRWTMMDFGHAELRLPGTIRK
ncbi:MAG TPA: M15 family metallopeptidase [Janthinobacterium sp.]|nr:M15 family metallopeptidase [Janthinobacterium sp.]